MRDRITRKITTALSVALVDQEPGANLPETKSSEAYDALLRGRAYYQLSTPADFVRAIPFLERAVELDPAFTRAHGVLAAVYWGICNNGWMESTGVSYQDCSAKTGYHLAEGLRKPTPLVHRIAARRHEYEQRWEEALLEAEKAIALNPNDPNGYVAMSALQVNLGRAEAGLGNIKTAMRLDPQSDYLWRLGYAQFHLERYDEAAATMLRATRRNPDYDWNYLLLAAAYGHLDREVEAREAVAVFNRLRFDTAGSKRPFTLADLKYWSIKNEAGLKRLREGMRKAGVPPGEAG
jgi:tetratricopeptide (TPR) repeat protein